MLRHSTGYKLVNDGADTRASEFAINGAVYGVSTGSVCEVLAGLMNEAAN
jgi:hypothetical protein